MQLQKSASRYSTASIALHWLMLLLLAAVYACIELRVQFPRGSDTRELLKTWHYMLGLTVPILVVLRLAARAIGPTPAIVPAPPIWQQRLARAVHVLLYALLLAMPLAGWLMLSAADETVPFFFFDLPRLLSPDPALARQIKEIHETAGVVGYWLIGLHALAALVHHYVLRDDTLRRMLPGRR